MEDAVENVRTIDSWQGREKEFMIFSSVRCNVRREIGFL
jgi:superfamily I DNA and/or RNA helicase